MNFQDTASVLIHRPSSSLFLRHAPSSSTPPSWPCLLLNPWLSVTSHLFPNNSFRGSLFLSDTRAPLPTGGHGSVPTSARGFSRAVLLALEAAPLIPGGVSLSLPRRPRASLPLTSSRSLARPPAAPAAPRPCPFRSFSRLLHNRARGCQPAPRNTL